MFFVICANVRAAILEGTKQTNRLLDHDNMPLQNSIIHFRVRSLVSFIKDRGKTWTGQIPLRSRESCHRLHGLFALQRTWQMQPCLNIKQ